MIETLLALALSLLIAAQDPKVTPELRQQAIEVATFAIQYAENPVNTTQAVERSVGGVSVNAVMDEISCNLTVSTTTNATGKVVGSATWESKNATKGYIWASTGMYSELFNVASGTISGAIVSDDLSFKAQFSYPDGEVGATCEAHL